MNKQQLELTFDGSHSFRPVIRRQRRLTSARWWFAQMHKVVDGAMDWQPATAPRPEQAHLKLAPQR
jgi:hypothetical protein